MDITRHLRLNVGQPTRAELTLVGCGGTGSFLALHMARLAWHARREAGLALHLTFVDPDLVEEKNIGRQNFIPAEIGQPKARALATRYSLAFGLSIHYFVEALHPGHVNRQHRYRDGWLHLIAGCVDNVAARNDIAEICDLWGGRLWWLDCGNHDHAGQVALGNSTVETPEISPLGFCSALPLPSIQHPELVEGDTMPISCADAVDQSLMINQAVAGWAAGYLYRLIVARDLDMYTTYFDLATGSARSEYIVA